MRFILKGGRSARKVSSDCCKRSWEKYAAEKLKKALIILLLGIIFLAAIEVSISSSPLMAEEKSEMEAGRERYSLQVQPIYTWLEPEEINDMMEDVHTWGNYMEDALTEDFQELIEDTAEDMEVLSFDMDRATTPMHTDDIENAPGIKGGLAYDIPDFFGPLVLRGGRIWASSSMSGEIKSETEIKHSGEEDFADDDLRFELSGEMENEVDININSVSLGFEPEIFENINLMVDLGVFWGSGEYIHESTGKMEHHPEDLDELDEEDQRHAILEELKKYDDDALLAYESDLKLAPTPGARVGASYDYSLTERVSLRASALLRLLDIEFESGDKQQTTSADGSLLEDYYQEEFDFQLPDKFEENLNGAELSLGINVDF